MNPIVKNILAVIAGFIVGSIVNMGIVQYSGLLIPPPEGVDPGNIESMKANIHLFQPKHFILPFLAHALGTLTGAFVAALLAASHKFKIAIGIGVFFFIGGLTAAIMLSSPIWFAAVDLIGAYIPMGWLGYNLAETAAKK